MRRLLDDPTYRLRAFLWLVALHSLGVGIMLVALPPSVMASFGYATVTERFFQVQGGVFHFVMVVAYVMAAADLRRGDRLVVFAIIVKFMATLFLVVYWLAADPILVVLLSGLGDGVMAVLLWRLHAQHRRVSAAA
jgi:hypothetical protein